MRYPFLIYHLPVPIKKFLLSFLLLVILVISSQPESVIIPVTYLLDESGVTEQLSRDPELTSFILSISDPDSSKLEGIYIEDKLQFPITSQPTNNPGFVSNSPDSITSFSTADKYGSIGLIAHNHLAGESFFQIDADDEICLVYGSGQVEKYVVSEIREYKALSPNSPFSSFIDLSTPDVTISYQDLFFETYGIKDRLVLQTCISRDEVESWGRLFIIASPVDPN